MDTEHSPSYGKVAYVVDLVSFVVVEDLFLVQVVVVLESSLGIVREEMVRLISERERLVPVGVVASSDGVSVNIFTSVDDRRLDLLTFACNLC